MMVLMVEEVVAAVIRFENNINKAVPSCLLPTIIIIVFMLVGRAAVKELAVVYLLYTYIGIERAHPYSSRYSFPVQHFRLATGGWDLT